jgi:hypothetical protein
METGQRAQRWQVLARTTNIANKELIKQRALLIIVWKTEEIKSFSLHQKARYQLLFCGKSSIPNQYNQHSMSPDRSTNKQTVYMHVETKTTP